MSEIRVAVIDDQELVRAGFIALLNASPGFKVIGEASDGKAAVRLVQQAHPDVALMDIQMPGMNGLEAIREIRADRTCDSTAIVVLTTFGLDEYLFGALRAGASGFLLKETPPEEFLRCIRVVAEGEALISASMTRRLIEHVVGLPQPAAAPMPDLTEREGDILRLVCEGLSNAQIAQRLYIGGATVKTYVSRLLGKFDVQSRVELVIAAYEAGFPRGDGEGS